MNFTTGGEYRHEKKVIQETPRRILSNVSQMGVKALSNPNAIIPYLNPVKSQH